MMHVSWPNGHRFAFTIVDDTDYATVTNVKPIYEMLCDLGMKTTKTVWLFPGEGEPVCEGATCEDQEYKDWLLSLQRDGFEIALHNVAPCTSNREVTRKGLDRFQELFGPSELLFCNHTHCRENIYWGNERLSGWRRGLYDLLTLGSRRGISRGHVENDPLFWGDLCRQQVRYVRNFVYDELNALAICPEQPYHDPSKPYVNYWFTSTDGHELRYFLKNFSEERLSRLAQAGGLCIAYVHFAVGFAQDGLVDPEFRQRMEYLASLDGWFVPASEVLDYLRQGAAPRSRTISQERIQEMERTWLFQKLLNGTS